MCESVRLKETLSKIESLAGAAAYLTDMEESEAQITIILPIADVAYAASQPSRTGADIVHNNAV